MRLDNWQNRLGKLINRRRKSAFRFPTFNCLFWAFEAIEAVTGVDYAKPYRGKLDTEVTALKFLKKKDGVTTCREVLKLRLGGELQPIAFARIGDIVFTKGNELLDFTDKAFGPIPGVCYGMTSFFLLERGLIEIPTMELDEVLWVS